MRHDDQAIRDRVVTRLRDLAALAERAAESLPESVLVGATMIRETIANGGTLFFCGNGGSAADAQHMSTEYVVRYMRNRRPIRAMALTTDTSILTAAANDLGFVEVFARQVEALARPNDLLIIHSTSGNSPNVIRAAEAARRAGVRVLALTANGGGKLRDVATHTILAPTDRTDRAQELHLCLEHVMCELVEEEL